MTGYHTVAFWVNSKPVGKQRPRVTRYSTYTPERTVEAEKAVRKAWEAAGSPALPGDVPIDAILDFYLERPQHHWRRDGSLTPAGQRDPHPVRSGRKNADLDNYTKLILDALNGCAYPDDAAITHLRVSKQWSARPSVYISLQVATR